MKIKNLKRMLVGCLLLSPVLHAQAFSVNGRTLGDSPILGDGCVYVGSKLLNCVTAVTPPTTTVLPPETMVPDDGGTGGGGEPLGPGTPMPPTGPTTPPTGPTTPPVTPPAAVPVPAAVWLFGSALIGLFGLSRRKA